MNGLPDDAQPYLGDMVILEKGLEPTEAHMLVACLAAAGIHADAGDTNMVQMHTLLSIAMGGASVRVAQSQQIEAKAVLAAYRRGDFALDDDFDPGVGPA
jgi:hypothetical protein